MTILDATVWIHLSETQKVIFYIMNWVLFLGFISITVKGIAELVLEVFHEEKALTKKGRIIQKLSYVSAAVLSVAITLFAIGQTEMLLEMGKVLWR